MINQTDLVAIFGKRGFGKSTLSKKIQRAMPRVVVVDLMHEYPVDKNSPIEFEAKSLPELAKILMAIERHELKRFRVIFRWPVSQEMEPEQLNKLFHLIYEFGDVSLVLEEIHHYMSREHMPLWLKNLVLLGRHKNVGIIATSQRPAEVSKTFVSQCIHVFVGRMFEKNDVKYFLGSLGVTESQLRNLEKFHFLRFLNGELQGKIST